VVWHDTRPAAQRALMYVNDLLTHTATGNTVTGASRTLTASGLVKVYAGAGSARYFGVFH